MTKMNKIAAGLAASLLLVSAAQVSAETVTSTATATVQNAFTLAEVSALDFGTFRATNDTAASAETATLTRPADPSASSTTTNGTTDLAALQSLVEGAPGEYTISGVANFSVMKLVLPSAAVSLTAPGNPPGVATFSADNWTANQEGTDITTSLAISTDINGEATFNIGATLSTVASANAYTDVAYSGDYIIEVTY